MIRDTHCDAEICGPAKLRGKGIVLNSDKWNNIIKHLHRGENETQASEQELKYKEYLRESSKAMTSTWENSLEKIRERKDAERERQAHEKVVEGEGRFKKLKEDDNAKRIEQIEAAQESIKRLKIGPRSLDTAFMLADVLTTRQQQCQQNADLAKIQREKKFAEGLEAQAQAAQWKDDYKIQLLRKKGRTDTYKQELRKHINSEDDRRQTETKKTIEMEREHRLSADRDLTEQLEKERAMLQRKKDLQRQNALEAMRMAEERRIRNQLVNEMEDKMVSIFAKGNNIPQITKRNAMEAAAEKERLREKINLKITAAFHKPDVEEAARQKAAAELEQRHEMAERSRIEHNRKMKAARIQQHLDEVERVKRLKQQKQNEAEWALANRYKNQEVNIEYDRQKYAQKQEKALALRKDLWQQIDAQQDRSTVKDAAKMFVEETNAADDKNFFEYANELIEEAQSKRRPILPIIKAVDQYKKENGLIAQREDLPHLQTNINIGLPSKDTIKYDAGDLMQLNKESTDKINAECQKRLLHLRIIPKMNKAIKQRINGVSTAPPSKYL